MQVNNKENRWDRVISLIKDKIKYANSSKEQKFFHQKGGNGFIKGDINKKVICQSVFDEMPDELKGDIKSANVFKKQIEGFMRRNNVTLW